MKSNNLRLFDKLSWKTFFSDKTDSKTYDFFAFEGREAEVKEFVKNHIYFCPKDPLNVKAEET